MSNCSDKDPRFGVLSLCILWFKNLEPLKSCAVFLGDGTVTRYVQCPIPNNMNWPDDGSQVKLQILPTHKQWITDAIIRIPFRVAFQSAFRENTLQHNTLILSVRPTGPRKVYVYLYNSYYHTHFDTRRKTCPDKENRLSENLSSDKPSLLVYHTRHINTPHQDP